MDNRLTLEWQQIEQGWHADYEAPSGFMAEAKEILSDLADSLPQAAKTPRDLKKMGMKCDEAHTKINDTFRRSIGASSENRQTIHTTELLGNCLTSICFIMTAASLGTTKTIRMNELDLLPIVLSERRLCRPKRNPEGDITLEEVASLLDLTPSEVSVLAKRTIGKLRQSVLSLQK